MGERVERLAVGPYPETLHPTDVLPSAFYKVVKCLSKIWGIDLRQQSSI